MWVSLVRLQLWCISSKQICCRRSCSAASVATALPYSFSTSFELLVSQVNLNCQYHATEFNNNPDLLSQLYLTGLPPPDHLQKGRLCVVQNPSHFISIPHARSFLMQLVHSLKRLSTNVVFSSYLRVTQRLKVQKLTLF